jgi:hypothetical protein
VKLINKNILASALLSVFILWAGEFSLYLLLKKNIEKEIIEHLDLERMFMLKKIRKGADILAFNNNIGDDITVTEIPAIQYKKPVLQNLEIEEEGEEEHFSSKEIVFDLAQNNKFYRVTIAKTIDEDEDLSASMWFIIFISGISILLVLVLINIIIHKKIFAPIYKLNKDINSFSVKKLKKIEPPKTSTVEFRELGESISNMSETIVNDYNSMKEFTENMAHEIQTPLSVISAKIEHCLQLPSLSEEEAILLTEASAKVNTLFNISKGLSLLSRLDNGQFNDPKDIDLPKMIEERLKFFYDFIESKKLAVTKDFQAGFVVKMDAVMCEILIDNLIKNAIKHNVDNGIINISISDRKLIMSNTGYTPDEDVNNYFKRFHTSNNSTSLGLGLSIVKKIVEYYEFCITYKFEDNLHVVTIKF